MIIAQHFIAGYGIIQEMKRPAKAGDRSYRNA
jgi:hypothetical protein